MHIVSASDDGFLGPFAAMLHSASLFHPDAQYWLLAQNVKASNRRKLKQFAVSNRIRLVILDITEVNLSGLRLSQDGEIACYARFLMPRLLPSTVDRALYLDADVTVTADLQPLFDFDLQHRPLAAVPDDPLIAMEERTALDLSSSAPYFNAGVLLFDLAAWRREELTLQLQNFIESCPVQLRWIDQSSLNAVLGTRIAALPPRWNFHELPRWNAAHRPAIVHYTANKKPWIDGSSAFAALYDLHQRATPFYVPLPVPTHAPLRRARRVAGGLLRIPRYQEDARKWLLDLALKRRIVDPAVREARKIMASRR